MFSVTTLDLVRLDSDHAAQNYTVHARAAERLATAALVARVTIVTLLAAATASAVAAVVVPQRAYAVAAAVAATLALVAFAIYAAVGVEARVGAHRQLAHRIWIVAQRYRSLVAELNDGAVDPALVRDRREELVHELHAVYEQGFGADQPAHERDRLPPSAADRAA